MGARTWEVAGTFTVSVCLRISDEEMARWADGQVSNSEIERQILQRGTIIERDMISVDYYEAGGGDDGNESDL